MQLEYFQMIDKINSYDPVERKLAASSKVPQESPIFEGHFPGHPLMPGVLLIETMAQTSGYLVLATTGFEQMPFLAGVKEGKLRTFVAPETPLEMEAVMVHDGSGFAITKASIKSEGKKICDAQLTFKTLPWQTEDFSAMMKKQALEMGMKAEFVPS
jgi:3-hydroxyacyl-[acyl-carrier-protein] dehydratase